MDLAVAIDEIESVFAGPVLVLPDKGHVQGEQRHRAIGTTHRWRKAFIVFTMRGPALRPISARYMHKREVEAYEQPIPTFKSDKEAEDFLDTADLSEFDLSGGELVKFEIRRKDKSVSLRLPETLLDEVRSHAKRAGMPYQLFMRLAIERAVQELKPK